MDDDGNNNQGAPEVDDASGEGLPLKPCSTGAGDVDERGKSNASVTDDGDDDDDVFRYGDMTLDELLDTPNWSERLVAAHFGTRHSLEEALMHWEGVLQRNLVEHDYNTFGSYVEFHEAFSRDTVDVQHFLAAYQPRLLGDSMSCVALSLQLMKDLIQLDARCGPLFSLVSCGEMFPLSAEREQIDLVRDCVKEHVMLCLKLTVG